MCDVSMVLGSSLSLLAVLSGAARVIIGFGLHLFTLTGGPYAAMNADYERRIIQLASEVPASYRQEGCWRDENGLGAR